ncbi:MAG: hypothetical protein H7Z37_18000, partial [Pyrinomonadaceae bacterium]|nr:hypothetical protein [Pyrinomonadaceae bacterium]
QPEPQVEIEARIVIASRNFTRDLGVQLSAVSVGGNGAGGIFSTLPGDSNNNFLLRGSNLGSAPGAGLQFPQPTNSSSGLGATAASTILGLTTGVFGTTRINALLTAAESKGQVKIVASPRVTTLNNRPAQIESGTQIAVQTQQGGAVTTGGTVFTTEFISVPLRLSVTPQITDAGTVVLRVIAENNSVNTALTNAGGTPGIDTQRTQTEVIVPDGGTTVIGGALQDNEAENRTQTPGLGSIPIIGELFKRRRTTRASSEIIFFITPRIYRPDYEGNRTASKVGDTNRSTTILQPVPLGNPPSNSGAPVVTIPQPTQPTQVLAPYGLPQPDPTQNPQPVVIRPN